MFLAPMMVNTFFPAYVFYKYISTVLGFILYFVILLILTTSFSKIVYFYVP